MLAGRRQGSPRMNVAAIMLGSGIFMSWPYQTATLPGIMKARGLFQPAVAIRDPPDHDIFNSISRTVVGLIARCSVPDIALIRLERADCCSQALSTRLRTHRK